MTRSEFDRKYTSQLNPQQLEAVHAVDGAVLLLAVPGRKNHGTGDPAGLYALLLRDLSGRDPDHDLHQGGHQGNAEAVRPAFWPGLSAGPGDSHDQRRFL